MTTTVARTSTTEQSASYAPPSKTASPPVPSSQEEVDVGRSAWAAFGIGLLQAGSLFLMITVLPHTFLASHEYDVTVALAHYGAYHQHPYNQAIHFVFVPLLMWTEMILFVHVPLWTPSAKIKLPGMPPHACNHATFWWAALTLMALTAEPLGGTLYAPILYLMYRGAVLLYLRDQQQPHQHSQWWGKGKLLQWALLGNAFSWIVQVGVGHHLFERNRPALLDSFGQSLSIAPLFSFYEGLWAVGINRPLQEKTIRQVAVLTHELCFKGGGAMRMCTNETAGNDG